MSGKRQTNYGQQVQLLWGSALVLMGVAFFFRIPAVINQIAEMEQFSAAIPFIRFALYLVGIFLVAGGAKKIHTFSTVRIPGNNC